MTALDVRIEQAIARNLNDEQAAKWAGCSPKRVREARRRLDAINAEPDLVMKNERHPRLIEAARREAALVYGSTVPEHHNGGS